MKNRVLSLTAAAMLLVVIAPHSAKVSRACTATVIGKVAASVAFHSPFTSARITIQGLEKSPAAEPPANGCACALRKQAPFDSIYDVQFVDEFGTPIPNSDWAWQDASDAADTKWAADAGTGAWTGFKG